MNNTLLMYKTEHNNPLSNWYNMPCCS